MVHYNFFLHIPLHSPCFILSVIRVGWKPPEERGSDLKKLQNFHVSRVRSMCPVPQVPRSKNQTEVAKKRVSEIRQKCQKLMNTPRNPKLLERLLARKGKAYDIERNTIRCFQFQTCHISFFYLTVRRRLKKVKDKTMFQKYQLQRHQAIVLRRDLNITFQLYDLNPST